ncbi:unnamed protein product [Bursaphelenchus okinawaensis]|uniref:Tyrosine-protein kinase n=1 Tax=Bursaphelenchus okinawaensis TaxID=465554 RepID=A0A811LKB4_9BILA|nr:unnamed protein product [Bursaphelenchus okinawaensis]CAG9124660.1 unnamed protein product [Bursaphelenchus okinawaensis]
MPESKAEETSPELSENQSTRAGIVRTKLIQVNSYVAGGVNKVLADEPYYHGFLGPEECNPLLRKNGDFIVRKTEYEGQQPYVISIYYDLEVHHYKVHQTLAKRLYYVKAYAFKTVVDLIHYHYRNHKPIAEDTYLKTPIRKETWQLFHEQVSRTKKLGEGAFGEVFLGELNLDYNSSRIPVAVKSLHTDAIETDERLKFLQEANIMRRLSHPNIVKLYGVCTSQEPIMVVMELAAHGSIVSKVQDKKDPPTDGLRVYFCYGAACGMRYLESKETIHRDIAARNCLLGENYVPKISDFGLSLLGSAFREKQLKHLPIRWLAPETLRFGAYSFKTDVWSFGVLMWEVYSNAETPYKHTENKQIKKGILDGTLKLRDVEIMPQAIKEVMDNCLIRNGNERPSFAELVDMLRPINEQYNPPTFMQRLKRICGKE